MDDKHIVFLSTRGWYFLHPITGEYHGPFDNYKIGCDAYEYAIRNYRYNEVVLRDTELISDNTDADAYVIMTQVYNTAFN